MTCKLPRAMLGTGIVFLGDSGQGQGVCSQAARGQREAASAPLPTVPLVFLDVGEFLVSHTSCSPLCYRLGSELDGLCSSLLCVF